MGWVCYCLGAQSKCLVIWQSFVEGQLHISTLFFKGKHSQPWRCCRSGFLMNGLKRHQMSFYCVLFNHKYNFWEEQMDEWTGISQLNMPKEVHKSIYQLGRTTQFVLVFFFPNSIKISSKSIMQGVRGMHVTSSWFLYVRNRFAYYYFLCVYTVYLI